ncbi:MAG TPA: hypothetical protein VHK22_02245 [Gaiellaceae bacterium]|nr:hypothetical protein [Gaiellaceae bacterium]
MATSAQRTAAATHQRTSPPDVAGDRGGRRLDARDATDGGQAAGRRARAAALLVLVLGGALGSVLVALLGTLQALDAPVGTNGVRPTGPLAAFALDVETNAASAWSALLLFAACLLALAVAPTERDRPAWPFWFFGSFLGFMAADEWIGLHERLQNAVEITWTTLYAPVFVAGSPAGSRRSSGFGRPRAH